MMTWKPFLQVLDLQQLRARQFRWNVHFWSQIGYCPGGCSVWERQWLGWTPIYIYIYIHTYTHTHAHTRTNTHIHTHTHTHTVHLFSKSEAYSPIWMAQTHTHTNSSTLVHAWCEMNPRLLPHWHWGGFVTTLVQKSNFWFAFALVFRHGIQQKTDEELGAFSSVQHKQSRKMRARERERGGSAIKRSLLRSLGGSFIIPKTTHAFWPVEWDTNTTLSRSSF